MILGRIKGVPLWMSASFIIACNAIVFGLDTGTIGPITIMPSFKTTFGEINATMHGVVVSAILLPGAITALFSGILADRYGRTHMVALGSLIYGIGGVFELAASHLGMFIIGRLIKGVGQGIFLSTVYVYVCEMSPAKVRGVVGALPQFLIVLGLVMGFFMCYGTTNLQGSVSWRLPIAIQAFLAFSNAGLCSLVPPSPRWLQAKGRPEEARFIIAQLGLDDDEQRELVATSSEGLEHSPKLMLVDTLRQALQELREAFQKPFRGRTAFGCYLLAMQQFSGIDGVLYYAPILLRQAGISSQQASFLASGVSALVILTVTIPATLFADAWGRRTSTLVGGTLISTLMFLMGSLYAAGEVHADRGAGRWIVIVSIYLFAFVFSGTWSIALRTFLIESLPRKTRSTAASLAQSSNWLANYTVALTTPVFIATSTFGAYFFFAICTMLCTVTCFVYMFETRGKTLEAIEQRYHERQSSRGTGR